MDRLLTILIYLLKKVIRTRTNSKKDWMELNPAKVNLFVGLFTLGAIIVTYHFSNESLGESRKQLKLAEDQFDYAKKQRRDVDRQERKEKDEARKRSAFQDSTQNAILSNFKKQSEIFSDQLIGQRELLALERERTAPNLTVSKIELDTTSCLRLQFTNIGERGCGVKTFALFVYNPSTGFFFPYFTDVGFIIEPKTGLIEPIPPIPKYALNDKNTLFLYVFKAEDFSRKVTVIMFKFFKTSATSPNGTLFLNLATKADRLSFMARFKQYRRQIHNPRLYDFL